MEASVRPEVVICEWLQSMYTKEGKLVVLRHAKSVHELVLAHTEGEGDAYSAIVGKIKEFISETKPELSNLVQNVSKQFDFSNITKNIPKPAIPSTTNSESDVREGAEEVSIPRSNQDSSSNLTYKPNKQKKPTKDKDNNKANKDSTQSKDKIDTATKKRTNLSNFGVLIGTVLWVREDERYGFIKVKKGDEFYFKLEDVCGDVVVKQKDTVEFQLLKAVRDKRPAAILVKPIKCYSRTSEEIMGYLQNIQEKVAYRGTVGTYVDPFLSICTVPAFWNFILNQLTLPEQAVVIILSLHEYFTMSATPHTNRLKQFCASYDNKPFVFSVLPTWIAIQMQSGTLFKEGSVDIVGRLSKRLLDFIRSYLVHCAPSSYSAIFPVFKALEKLSGSGAFFLEMMQFMVPKCKEITAATKWFDMPLVLVPHEYLLSEIAPVDVPTVKAIGPYNSVEDYFNTYIRLLREDCFFDMRLGISNMLEGKATPMNSFLNIRFSGIHFLRRGRGVCYCLRFTPLRAVKNWKETSQLQYGNLLCISIDGTFGNPIWATVHMQRTEETIKMLQTGKVFVRLCYDFNGQDDISVLNMLLTSDMKKSVMVESPVFYMSYQSTLRELKKKTTESMPFLSELVAVKTPSNPIPEYINTSTTKVDWTIISKTTKLNTFANIDAALNEVDTLDSSQVRAVKHALTNRVALIQGPPGTGKSFVGVTLLRLILSMRPTPIGPVLVMTYKNHALDQFMGDCKKYFPKEVVRVGSGCEDNEISLDTLFQAHLQTQHHKRKEFFQNRQKLALLQEQLEELLTVLQRLAMEELVHFDLKMLLETATVSQVESLLAKAPSHISNKAKSFLHHFNEAYIIDSLLIPMDDSYKKLVELLDSALTEWRPASSDFPFVPSNQPRDAQPNLVEGGESSSEEKLTMDDVRDVEHDRAVMEDLEDEDWESNGFYNLNFAAGKSETNKMVVQAKNLWALSDSDRAAFIRTKLGLVKKETEGRFQALIQEYQKICDESEDTNNSLKVEILQSAKVIGFTISGGAIYSNLIAAVKPSVIIIEEAGEVLEAQLIATINKNTQHLIMIGDHQQLRPPVNSYHLAKDHKFDISLLERLINNYLPYETLHSQSRMREEFVPLLHGFYPKLQSNTAIVRNRIAPPCMRHSLYFWSYTGSSPNCFETKTNGTSITNPFEAKMAVALAAWIVWNDGVQGKVTILTPYQGQVATIKKLLQQFRSGSSDFIEAVRKIPVHSIDRFQGDENEKIVLSLVRHNRDNKLGFSAIPNRIVVALSRAQCGLYIIGQSAFFSHNSPEWKNIIEYFKKIGKIGTKIDILCPSHPTKRWSIGNASELESPFLCDEICLTRLPCGHKCTGRCHAGGPHVVCTVSDVVTLSCGHTCDRPCSIAETLLECNALCGKPLPCGHSCTFLCSEACDPRRCEVCNAALREEHLLQKKKRKDERDRVKLETQAEARRIREHYEKNPPKASTREVTDAHTLHHISDLVTKFIQPKHNCVLRVQTVHEIVHPELHHNWAAVRGDLVDPVAEYRELFHGTSIEGIEGITKEGFRLPPENHKAMFGRGVYFATDSTKSARNTYVKNSDSLLLCHVWLGKVKTVNSSFSDLNAEKMRILGYDSIYAERATKATGGVFYDEFVVYNPKQALPKYIIKFERITHMETVDLAFKSLQPTYSEREILRSRVFTSSDDDVYFRIAEAQFLRMIYPQRAEVQKVVLIQNPDTTEKFMKKQKQLYAKHGVESQVVLAFHGTEEINISSICRNNFDMKKIGTSNGQVYGAGIYFSEKSITSHHYTRGHNKMLLCKLLLGKEYAVTLGNRLTGASLQPGYDCHNVGDGNVIVIFEPSQILPIFVVHYSVL